MLNEQTLEAELKDTSETFVLLSYITMYSFFCPFIAIMVLINNLLVGRFQRRVQLLFIIRKPMMKENGIGFFEDIVGILSKMTVIMNCVFLFWFRAIYAHTIIHVTTFLQPFMPNIDYRAKIILKNTVKQMEKISGIMKDIELLPPAERKVVEYEMAVKFIVIIVIMEHFLFLMKFLIEEYIPDIAPWVKRSEIATQFQIERIALEQKEIEKKDAVNELRN